MGWLSKIVGSGIGEAAEGVASAIDRFVETDEERQAAAVLNRKIDMEPLRWQAEINKIEAAHRSIFIAGWRPFAGWVCGIGLAWSAIGQPIAHIILQACALDVKMPEIDTGELITLLFALLGLGGIRSYEKKNNLTI